MVCNSALATAKSSLMSLTRSATLPCGRRPGRNFTSGDTGRVQRGQQRVHGQLVERLRRGCREDNRGYADSLWRGYGEGVERTLEGTRTACGEATERVQRG
eukprot:1187835-Prorocentrum_minimum.AAC.2